MTRNLTRAGIPDEEKYPSPSYENIVDNGDRSFIPYIDHSSESDGPDDSSAEAAEETRLLQYHLSLLTLGKEGDEIGEVRSTPVFTMPVLKHVESIRRDEQAVPFSQYGLLAGMAHALSAETDNEHAVSSMDKEDPRVFFNISAPSSTFICGSQGSGKSHTLSCLLENCLMPSDVNVLPMPLAGLVFHYDTFISD
jgi:hypothetical protein